jgi:hypothetical protein
VGGAALGDARLLIAVGETALLAVRAGSVRPQRGPALRDRDVATHERPCSPERQPASPRRTDAFSACSSGPDGDAAAGCASAYPINGRHGRQRELPAQRVLQARGQSNLEPSRRRRGEDSKPARQTWQRAPAVLLGTDNRVRRRTTDSRLPARKAVSPDVSFSAAGEADYAQGKSSATWSRPRMSSTATGLRSSAGDPDATCRIVTIRTREPEKVEETSRFPRRTDAQDAQAGRWNADARPAPCTSKGGTKWGIFRA